MSMKIVKIRATISVAGITVVTPYIQSFNVRKQRGQVSSCDASLKVNANILTSTATAGALTISAGTLTSQTLIFTGVCRSAKISPCYDDPKYVILSVGGADTMSLLQGKKYTRRCRSTKSTWVAITGVTRDGLKSGKFAYQNEPTIEIGPGVQAADESRTAYGGTSAESKNSTGELTDLQHESTPNVTIEILNDGDE